MKTAVSEGLTIKGFVIASLFMQDNNFGFGNGQNAQWPSSDFSTDETTFGGDVRNTRLTLAFNGPDADNFKVGGTVEVDFFGGFNGAGAFSDEQQILRLRLAYVDVTRGKTTFRVGQAWSPMFGNVPASPTHVAFPLGYGTGMPGWRFPGLFVYHDFGGSDNFKTKLTLALMRGSWSGSTIDNNSPGEAGTPQIEGRLDFSGKNWSVYVVGHYDQKDLSGVGAEAPDDSLDGTAVEVGAKVKFGMFTLAGNFYDGSAIGQQFGAITQFGDIDSKGGWVQGSFQFSPKWAAHLFYGIDDPDDFHVVDSGNNRLKNEQIAASVMYSSGPYVLGVEWLNASLDKAVEDSETEFSTVNVDGNQVSFSVWYKF